MKYNQLTTEIFIKKAKQVHSDKYDYSKVKYIDANTKVCIICPEHGEFWQRPASHLNGCGCKYCGFIKRTKKITNNRNQFIEKAKQIHGDKYDYSKVEYINGHTKVCIICPIHGEFWQTPNSHLNGCGCNLCSKPIHDKESFIKEASKKHNREYDYSKVDYVDSQTKVCIICPIHGEFWQTPSNHMKGEKCPICSKEKQQQENRKRAEKAKFEFETKARKIHKDKYDYSKVKYINNHTKICIICPEHGEFWQTPAKHLMGSGCLKCSESKLEREVRILLEENHIDYIQECDHTIFKWLKKLRLDFYLPKYNIAIECQGEQHYFPVSFGCLSKQAVLQRFKNIVKYDLRKKECCNKNGIKLIYYTTEKLKKDNEITNKTDLIKNIINE